MAPSNPVANTVSGATAQLDESALQASPKACAPRQGSGSAEMLEIPETQVREPWRLAGFSRTSSQGSRGLRVGAVRIGGRHP
eukprot:5889582-Alexandrium_andersonii.AAC.1